MSSSKSKLRRQALFGEALPIARRAADIRSRGAAAVLRTDASLDRDDVRQEVALHLWMALARFDPERAGLTTFVERLAQNSVSTILRRMEAKKRRQPQSPESGSSQDPRKALQVRLDLNSVLTKLGSRERKVARLLIEDSSAGAARRLRISRSALYRSVGRIRTALCDAGYGNYFIATGHFAENSRI